MIFLAGGGNPHSAIWRLRVIRVNRMWRGWCWSGRFRCRYSRWLHCRKRRYRGERRWSDDGLFRRLWCLCVFRGFTWLLRRLWSCRAFRAFRSRRLLCRLGLFSDIRPIFRRLALLGVFGGSIRHALVGRLACRVGFFGVLVGLLLGEAFAVGLAVAVAFAEGSVEADALGDTDGEGDGSGALEQPAIPSPKDMAKIMASVFSR